MYRVLPTLTQFSFYRAAVTIAGVLATTVGYFSTGLNRSGKRA